MDIFRSMQVAYPRRFYFEISDFIFSLDTKTPALRLSNGRGFVFGDRISKLEVDV